MIRAQSIPDILNPGYAVRTRKLQAQPAKKGVAAKRYVGMCAIILVALRQGPW